MPYADTDFVYFDPETKTVIGPVQWSKNGNVKPLEQTAKPGEPARSERSDRSGGQERGWRRHKKEYYLWGSMRSLNKLYHLQGKEGEKERTQTLDEALGRALSEPYWD